MIMNPVLRRTIGKMVRLERVASMGGVELSGLLSALAGDLAARTGDKVEIGAPPSPSDVRRDRQEALKGIIRDLHRGEDLEALKQRFRVLIHDVAPTEIAAMEQALIDEGMPEDEIKRLCDVHVQVFKESLEGREPPDSVPGHPLHTLMAENRALEGFLAQLRAFIPEPELGTCSPAAGGNGGGPDDPGRKAGRGGEALSEEGEPALPPARIQRRERALARSCGPFMTTSAGHLKDFSAPPSRRKDLDSAFRLGRFGWPPRWRT